MSSAATNDGQLESLHVEALDRDALVAALHELAAEDGFRPVAPGDLAPHGRWLHGDEDPSVRRYLVSPPGARWITVLPSATDWHAVLTQRLSATLETRVVQLMLHDDDVLTATSFEEGRQVASHCSSPVHFDREAPGPARLREDARALLGACRSGVTVAEVEAALSPPGRIDVDGRSALAGLASLLDLPEERAATSYRDSLGAEALSPGPAVAEWTHVAFRQGDPEADEEDDRAADDGPAASPPGEAVVLRFPGPRDD